MTGDFAVMACHMKVCRGNDLESIGDFIPDVFSALRIASEIGSDLLQTIMFRFCKPFSFNFPSQKSLANHHYLYKYV